MYVIIFHDRDRAYVNDHKLCFDRCDIHGLVLELFSNVVVIPDMGYDICSIGFFNPTISDNSCITWRVLRLMEDLIEILNMFVNVFREGEERRI